LRLTSLRVQAAHGYLDLNIKLNKQLTFLVGINGSGKTTALRIIESLLTPSLPLLDKVPHKKAELRLVHDKKIIKIVSVVNETYTRIQIPALGEDYVLEYTRDEVVPLPSRSPATIDPLQERYNALHLRLATNPVWVFLRKTLDTPIFLGLDRRNISLNFDEIESQENNSYNPRRREMMLHSMRRRMPVSGQLGSSLVDVQVLIQEIYRETREEQEKFATKLREQMFLHAFDIQPSAGFTRALNEGHTMPNFLASIVKKRTDVEKALKDAGLEKNAFDPVVNRFFTHIEELIRKYNDVSKSEKVPPNILVDLALNRPVVDRVQKLIATSENYNASVAHLWAPINQFLNLVNRFLIDTNKRLEIDQVGLLTVRLPDQTIRSLDILSSGERQIVVILGHLAINRELNRAGIFVVDEPELSLHLKWQEIFVESLLLASPKNQFILATHSPAIILDRGSECESLDERIGEQ
jgi:predicted ATPase